MTIDHKKISDNDTFLFYRILNQYDNIWVSQKVLKIALFGTLYMKTYGKSSTPC